MLAWTLPTFVFLVWGGWAVTAAAQVAAADARRGVPVSQRRGVSIAPVIPVFPLVAWGLAWLGDWVAKPLGTVLVGALHAILAVTLVVSLVRSWWYLRSFEDQSGTDDGIPP